jgi:hypothetical protein
LVWNERGKLKKKLAKVDYYRNGRNIDRWCYKNGRWCEILGGFNKSTFKLANMIG